MVRACLAIVFALFTSAGISLAGTSFVGGGISITTSNCRALCNAGIGWCGGWNQFCGPAWSNGIDIYNWAGWGWPNYPIYYQGGSWYWYTPIYSTLPIIDIVRLQDPQLMNAIVGPALPKADPAMVDLHQGRYADAAARFLARATTRERAETTAASEGGVVIPDRSALRLHALALAGAGDMRGASRAFAEAHAEDPLLGADPIDGARVLSSVAEVRRIVLEGIQFAQRDNQPASWALVGYLMQVQGRYDESRAMLAKARAGSPVIIE